MLDKQCTSGWRITSQDTDVDNSANERVNKSVEAETPFPRTAKLIMSCINRAQIILLALLRTNLAQRLMQSMLTTLSI